MIACRRRFHFVRELGEDRERLLEVEAAEADAEVVRVKAEGALSYYKKLLLGHRALAHLGNVVGRQKPRESRRASVRLYPLEEVAVLAEE